MPATHLEPGEFCTVTDDLLQEWRRLSDEVFVALSVGGESGLGMLMAVMPEWRDAVTDAGLALDTCIRLASRGRRHEAMQWHADGFLDVVRRLVPESGHEEWVANDWEEWKAFLRERGVAIPSAGTRLEDFMTKVADLDHCSDRNARSLGHHLDLLRRNVLSHASLGERLVILEAIRRLDPACEPHWQAVIDPIRGRRGESLHQELLLAVSSHDRGTARALIEEIRGTAWGDALPLATQALADEVTRLLSGFDGYEVLLSAAEQFERAMDAIEVYRLDDPTLLEDASFRQAIDFVRSRRKEVDTALASFQVMERMTFRPDVTAWMTDSGMLNLVRQVVERLRPRWDRLRRVEAHVAGLERWQKNNAALRAHVSSACVRGGVWVDDGELDRIKAWLVKSERLVDRVDRAGTKTAVPMPESTRALLGRLDELKHRVEDRLARIISWRWVLVVTVLGLVALLTVALIGTLIWSAVGYARR